MAITMTLMSAVICFVFLVDFAKTINDLQKDRLALKEARAKGFSV
ncbi:hypothetical protein [Xaviernesmea oryzae]|nr:hypothetical protein [Xaviernesmea oryzae]SEK48728.1 hypothetical protein SAMN04487976_102297 [Xaviernesmea oryzae]